MAVSNDELADCAPEKVTWAHLGIIWPTKLSLVVLCVLEDTVRLSKKLGVPATGHGKTLNALPVET